jgi:DNA-binding transcriptional regulator YiaG
MQGSALYARIKTTMQPQGRGNQLATTTDRKENQMNQYTHISHNGFRALSGDEIVSMMRKSRVTIRQVAKTHNLSMKRVRELRNNGVPSGLRSWEIFWLIRETQIKTSA